MRWLGLCLCILLIPIAEPEFINEVYLHPTSHIGGTPMSGRKLTVDWKHTAEELYAHYNNTPNTQIARRFQASPCSDAAEPSKKLPKSSACPFAPSKNGSLGIAQGDWTNSPVARAGATESLCAPC